MACHGAFGYDPLEGRGERKNPREGYDKRGSILRKKGADKSRNKE
jgi:hypothetical protein